MTFRSNDDKYIFLPKALSNRTEQSINELRKEFGEFSVNETHGEYDRGYFKALEDYTALLSTLKLTSNVPNSSQPNVEPENAKPAKGSDSDLTPYLAGSS